jgi:opacity protein-like surface antigen
VITRITVFGIALVVMIGAAAQAQAQAQEDFSRPGFYVGTGLALGVEAWDDAGFLSAELPIGVDAWLGYRVMPNLAVEAEIEYLNGFDPKGVSVDALTTTANLKAYLPIDRFQPFALVGIGVTTYFVSPDGFPFDDRSAFSARFGGGADYYLTENIALGVRVSYVLVTGASDESDYVDYAPDLIGALDAGDYVSFTWGAQYRF